MGKANLIKFTFVLVSAIALSACGGGKKKSEGSSSASSVDPNAPLALSAVQGTWAAGCAVDSVNGGSYKDILIISGNTYISRADFSPNADCSAADLALDINGTFQLLQRSTVVPLATNLTMTSVNGGITPKSAAVVTQANTEGWCGLVNWQLNVRQIVPLACLGITAGTFTDIIALQGSTLIFGDATGTALDPNYSYQRQ